MCFHLGSPNFRLNFSSYFVFAAPWIKPNQTESNWIGTGANERVKENWLRERSICEYEYFFFRSEKGTSGIMIYSQTLDSLLECVCVCFFRELFSIRCRFNNRKQICCGISLSFYRIHKLEQHIKLSRNTIFFVWFFSHSFFGSFCSSKTWTYLFSAKYLDSALWI